MYHQPLNTLRAVSERAASRASQLADCRPAAWAVRDQRVKVMSQGKERQEDGERIRKDSEEEREKSLMPQFDTNAASVGFLINNRKCQES